MDSQLPLPSSSNITNWIRAKRQRNWQSHKVKKILFKSQEWPTYYFCCTILTHNQVQCWKGLIQELTIINDHQEELLWSPNFSRAFFYKEFCLAYTVLNQILKLANKDKRET